MSAFLRDGLRTGKWDRIASAAEWADTLTSQLRAISHDQHVHLILDAHDPRIVENVSADERTRRRNAVLEEIADANYGFPEVRILPGNIGYVRMDNFNAPSLAAPTLAATMAFVNHSRGLIVDLRENGGGHEDQYLLMMSYFLSTPQKIGESFSRPDSTVQQSWTYAVVPGPRYEANKPVYVLLGRSTFSAAEALGAALRTHRNAILVGDTTRGGGHMGDFLPVGDRFMLFVPSAASTRKDEVEGVGLRPDVSVPAARALEEAHLRILRAVLATIKDPTQRQAFEQFEREAATRLSASQDR